MFVIYLNFFPCSSSVYIPGRSHQSNLEGVETFDDKNFPESRMVRENFSRPIVLNFEGRLRRHVDTESIKKLPPSFQIDRI